MNQPQYIEEEYCPSCGQFVDSLNDNTGWCNLCSGVTPCLRCNKPLVDRAVSDNEKLCNSCKYIVWLETNADAIDRTMAEYCVSAAQAKRIVLQQNRPICLSCHNPIKGGTKGRHIFCTKTAECRKAQNAYRYYYNYKRLPQDEAIQKALYAATEFSLIVMITHRHRGTT